MSKETHKVSKILSINLSSQNVTTVKVSERDLYLFLGGKGLALKFYHDNLPAGTPPFSEDNFLIFMNGPLTGSGAVCSQAFTACTKSPLTGYVTTCICHGEFGPALNRAGWTGLAIRGKSPEPIFIVIEKSQVLFQSAQEIWGKDTQASYAFLRKYGEGIITIGPAGENLVPYSSIVSGQFNCTRGGFGAIMGWMNLKGLVSYPENSGLQPCEERSFEKTNKKIRQSLNRCELSSNGYRSYGTPFYVSSANKQCSLPVRNFTGGAHGESHKITGENIAQRYNLQFDPCQSCAILCVHRGIFDGVNRREPDYHSLVLLGSNLNIYDPERIAEWNELCTLQGLDPVSTAVSLAWAMEAGEKGLFETQLCFGIPAGISKTIRDIALRRGAGGALSKGTLKLSRNYGGQFFSMNIKGLEISGIDLRGSTGSALAHAVSNAGPANLYSPMFILETVLHRIGPYVTDVKPHLLALLEDIQSAVMSLVMCDKSIVPVLLESGLMRFLPDSFSSILLTGIPGISSLLFTTAQWEKLWESMTGIHLAPQDFIKAGRRIHTLERLINNQEGMRASSDKLPCRFTDEGRKCDPSGRTMKLKFLIKSYYKIRGYSRQGVPLKSTLDNLNLGLLKRKDS